MSANPRFTISPTVSSGLSGSTWVLALPAPQQWSVAGGRVTESTPVLAGSTVHSVWPFSVTNGRPEYRQVIEEADYAKLRTFYEHATVTSWIIGADGRAFEAAIADIKETRQYRSGRQMRDVTIQFLIIRELSL
jgi:hypothetical protein